MATVGQSRATLDDLMRVEGKAELIDGRIVEFMPTGHIPSRVAFRIAMRLEARSIEVGHGEAHPEGVKYAVSGIFSPDAFYYSPASIDPGRGLRDEARPGPVVNERRASITRLRAAFRDGRHPSSTARIARSSASTAIRPLP